ncbi:hypothetical protein ACFL51_01245 [Myxococcota bacterium]
MKLVAEEDRHLEVVRNVIDVHVQEAQGSDERGWEHQRPRRELEHAVRCRAAELTRRLRPPQPHQQQRWTFLEVGRRLGLAENTLGDWRRSWEQGQLQSRPLGRPAQRLSPAQREALWATLELVGPAVGIPTLHGLHPDIAIRELRYQLRQYRKTFRDGHRRVVHVLLWERAGTVWAMDFTDPLLPIDGWLTTILVVRDLGSDKIIEALPLARATVLTVRTVIHRLFLKHGARLVMKVDNDTTFLDSKVKELLEHWDVELFRSPPYSPWYNGGFENGNGTMKACAFHQACRHDRPEHWSCDDIESARRLANVLGRPHGPDGPSPAELWDKRPRITKDGRDEFRRQVEVQRSELIINETEHTGTAPDEVTKAVIERAALSRSLRNCGFLSVRRRRIFPVIKVRGWTRI